MELHALGHTLIGAHSDWGTLGLGHTRIGAHLDWVTLGLGHTWIGAHLDWGPLGLGHTLVGTFKRGFPELKWGIPAVLTIYFSATALLRERPFSGALTTVASLVTDEDPQGGKVSLQFTPCYVIAQPRPRSV